jgi:hypothetical protein
LFLSSVSSNFTVIIKIFLDKITNHSASLQVGKTTYPSLLGLDESRRIAKQLIDDAKVSRDSVPDRCSPTCVSQLVFPDCSLNVP